MFKTKEEFKEQFTTRIVEHYGHALDQSNILERYMVLGEIIKDYDSVRWMSTKQYVNNTNDKQLFYFSLEFLMGRLLTNNLMNLGIYDTVKEGLVDLKIDLNELEDIESDAGLGNGGLGRLAACFMDSLASQSFVGHGQCIRYDYGLFKQKIVDNKQVEVLDHWLKFGNVWETRKPSHAVSVNFWGDVEIYRNAEGNLVANHVNAQKIQAVPYDVPIIGSSKNITNTLRLWRAEPSDDLSNNTDFNKYLKEVSEINQNLYPDDSNEHGKYLRLKQQYFFTSAGLQGIVKKHLKNYGSLDNLDKKVVIQLNDTHPVLAIPELMRILMDEHNYLWDDAFKIVTNTMAYTNHTILHEALEKWPLDYVRKLLPRVYQIIEEINRRFIKDLRVANKYDNNFIERVAIIKDGLVYMAHLAIVGSFSVNGVAKLHSDILINDALHDFYLLYPNKFNNKTNGITHRRWLLYSNPQLTNLIKDTIGDSFISDFDKLHDLMDHVDSKELQEKFMVVKNERKEILAKYIKKNLGIELNINSIFDVQAKRFHAYKRQLLNVLHIISKMHEIDKNPDFNQHHQTFFFAGKAAAAYHFAKSVIELINVVAFKVNNSLKYSKYIKVVFIPNYSVSIAEILMNAADVSEQISMAGKEASGTGNMKFMMNGALTLGTLDGANVEIDSLVERDNTIIFGNSVESVKQIKSNGYNAQEMLEENPILKEVVESLHNGYLCDDLNKFENIYEELIYHNDEYLLLADFMMYKEAQMEVQNRYADRLNWVRSCLINIAKSAYFSSDRTIRDYAKDIWKIEKVNNNEKD
ncbi:MAG: glycogen/starch/alpha-glucan family phosphorylase [Anaerorhabdus sp.]